jgi:RNA polymerase-binding protein
VASGNAIRGIRVGSGPIRPDERCEPAPTRPVAYWCANGHQVEPLFAADAAVPARWECPRCGLPAGRDQQDPPGRPRAEPYKTHLAYVKERRSEAEGAAILAEALRQLRQRRGEE